MNIRQCLREHEVVAAVSSGRWHDELHSHVSACAICADVLEVATALRAEYQTISRDVAVPAAGLVWWRAELRARREALRVAERPMTLVHAFAAAGAVGGVGALLNQLSPLFRESIGELARFVPDNPATLVQQHLPLSLLLGALLLLAPVVLYFVISEE